MSLLRAFYGLEIITIFLCQSCHTRTLHEIYLASLLTSVYYRKNCQKFGNVLQIGRRSDRQRARRRLLINGAAPRKGDEVLAVTAEAIGEEKLQKSDRYNMSNYSAGEGQGFAYKIYKKAGDWWKCVFLHGGTRSCFAFCRAVLLAQNIEVVMKEKYPLCST